jgi:hypothetical protein
MNTLYDAPSWAESEFGHAAVPDARNVARLVQMAQRVAERPHAKVSAVFDAPAELEAAYDFLENDRVAPEALVASSLRATARRARDLPRVLVAVDGVSLTLRDPHDTRGTGSVGDRASCARGLHAIDAVALTEDGVPLGLAAMQCWARSLKRVTRSRHQRTVAEKETRHWIEARAAIREGFGREAPDTQLVLLHDSATDAWPVLVEAMAQDAHAREITVLRAAHDRRASAEPGSPSHLWSLLRRAPDRWTIRMRIPPRDGHPARRAKLEIRARPVTLDLRLKPSRVHLPVELWAVRVHEVGRLPAGVKRLEWVLLTDWPLRTRAAVLTAIRWYTLRWRVEDHHKIWKGSGSDIEETQLHSRRAIERWMAIHAAVSARALALTHQARDPQAGSEPAAREFTGSELLALRALRAARGMETPPELTVAQAARLVAILGGFRPISDRPFGPTTLRRGLERLVTAATAIAALESTGPPKETRKTRAN